MGLPAKFVHTTNAPPL